MEGDTRITPEPSDIPDNSPDSSWFAEFADSMCSYWMTVGVPCHEFWHGDPATFRFYEETHREAQRHENFLLWLQGRYIYEAIGDMVPVLHAFAKEGTQPVPYPKEPYPITEKDVREREERERLEKYERLKAYVSQWAGEQNRKNTRKENNDG